MPDGLLEDIHSTLLRIEALLGHGPTNVEPEPGQWPISKDIPVIELCAVYLSTRVSNVVQLACEEKMGVSYTTPTLEEFVAAVPQYELLAYKNFGSKSLDEVRHFVKRAGLLWPKQRRRA